MDYLHGNGTVQYQKKKNNSRKNVQEGLSFYERLLISDLEILVVFFSFFCGWTLAYKMFDVQRLARAFGAVQLVNDETVLYFRYIME